MAAAPSFETAFKRVRICAEATGLHDFEVSTSYGTPALKRNGKLLVRLNDKDPATLVLMSTLGDKELMMASAPHIYFETDHYKGYPALLIRLAEIGDAELTVRLTQAWQLAAPKPRAARVKSVR
jgi:hypothetical protein